MKTNKEYPATHSMDTAWFAEDLDGNIAIFQFEEDGPGPSPFTDMHTDELISYLGDNSNIHIPPEMPFTKDQIEELKKGLKPVHKVEDIDLRCNVMIEPSKVQEVIDAGAFLDLCYSKKEGFYHLEWWQNGEDKIEYFMQNNYFIAANECNVEIYFEDLRENQTEHRLAHFPFYVYEQDYGLEGTPEKVVTPVHPMKIDQLPESARKYTFKLPVRFSEHDKIEPAEFIDSIYWSTNGHHCKEVGDIEYMQVILTNGELGYVKILANGEDVSEEPWKSAPRVIERGCKYIDPYNIG